MRGQDASKTQGKLVVKEDNCMSGIIISRLPHNVVFAQF